jgi:hypothetical protein
MGEIFGILGSSRAARYRIPDMPKPGVIAPGSKFLPSSRTSTVT